MDDDGLKLAAMDEADLAILSAHLQDAVLKRSDMRYAPARRRFALACNRFDWIDAARKDHGGLAGLGRRAAKLVGRGPTYRRRRASLVFDHVTHAAESGLAGSDPDEVLNLLSIAFAPQGDAEDPSGHVILHFAGGGRMRLGVECVEARLVDEGPVWSTHARPRHRAETA